MADDEPAGFFQRFGLGYELLFPRKLRRIKPGSAAPKRRTVFGNADLTVNGEVPRALLQFLFFTEQGDIVS
jgi:hypothetical protein